MNLSVMFTFFLCRRGAVNENIMCCLRENPIDLNLFVPHVFTPFISISGLAWLRLKKIVMLGLVSNKPTEEYETIGSVLMVVPAQTSKE